MPMSKMLENLALSYRFPTCRKLKFLFSAMHVYNSSSCIPLHNVVCYPISEIPDHKFSRDMQKKTAMKEFMLHVISINYTNQSYCTTIQHHVRYNVMHTNTDKQDYQTYFISAFNIKVHCIRPTSICLLESTYFKLWNVGAWKLGLDCQLIDHPIVHHWTINSPGSQKK